MEQEKYHLRRRLETAQEEYELKTSELQSDVSTAYAQLEEASAAARNTEREKSQLIATLTEQNQRLTSQLKERARAEEAMATELKGLRDQVNLKRTSMNEHVSHLDMLRDEVGNQTFLLVSTILFFLIFLKSFDIFPCFFIN